MSSIQSNQDQNQNLSHDRLQDLERELDLHLQRLAAEYDRGFRLNEEWHSLFISLSLVGFDDEVNRIKWVVRLISPSWVQNTRMTQAMRDIITQILLFPVITAAEGSEDVRALLAAQNRGESFSVVGLTTALVNYTMARVGEDDWI